MDPFSNFHSESDQKTSTQSEVLSPERGNKRLEFHTTLVYVNVRINNALIKLRKIPN